MMLLLFKGKADFLPITTVVHSLLREPSSSLLMAGGPMTSDTTLLVVMNLLTIFRIISQAPFRQLVRSCRRLPSGETA